MPVKIKERPIFIIGAERSGTTLIMAMLGCHKRLAIPEVVWYYSRFRPYIFTYGDLKQDNNFRTLVEEMAFNLKTPFWGMPVNPSILVEEIIQRSQERSFAGVYTAMLEKYAAYVEKPRWGEKTPYNLFFIKEILEDFPNAQFIFITRDGRDASADYLESSFGPTNIYTAARAWQRAQQAVVPWREKLSSDQWLDVCYEKFVRNPEREIKKITDFLKEDYDPAMLSFYKGEIAFRRGQTRDHAPLIRPVNPDYIGIYKNLLSIRDQRIFIGVAGSELVQAGYEVELKPLELNDKEKEHYIELDGRFRAASLDMPEGHIVYESCNDWLIDQREKRRQAGLWNEKTAPKNFPIGDPDEEMIMGQRAWRNWKKYFCIKPRYTSNKIVL